MALLYAIYCVGLTFVLGGLVYLRSKKLAEDGPDQGLTWIDLLIALGLGFLWPMWGFWLLLVWLDEEDF